MQKELVRIFENEKSKDSEAYLSILEDLDLFAFTPITVNKKLTNVLKEALNHGFEKMVEYIFAEGFTNIRALLKVNNCFEFENEVS